MDKIEIINILREKKVPDNCIEHYCNSQIKYEAKFGPMDPKDFESIVGIVVGKGCHSPF